VFAISLTAEWAAWVTALAAPLHRRLAWRMTTVVLGILMAQGRRTASRLVAGRRGRPSLPVL